jgi:hypothetical protein
VPELGLEANMSFRVKLALLVALILFAVAHATGAFMLARTSAAPANDAKFVTPLGD